VRKVPIPPELVELLRAHLEAFGVAPDGRLFRSESGNPLQPSTWWQVWQKVRAASLTPEQLASPLMKRPYDLRHSGVTWRLNSGVPATEVAAWAGHSVEVLTRVYARCVVGLEGVWIGRMDEALHLGRTDDLGRLGPRMGRRIRQMTASAGTTCPRTPISLAAFSQVRARLTLVMRGAPSRIRICAHGSGESKNLGL
jgi:hypothetical protein